MFVLETLLTAQDVRNDHALRHSVVIVIDVFRATTTMCHALQNGAYRIIPVTDLEVAQDIAAELKKENSSAQILLCGERGGIKPHGFDLGNSPLEYTSETVRHKTLVITTTNGTQALERSRHAALQLIGGFVNIRATVEYLLAVLRNPKLLPTPIHRILLVCAGTEGISSLEDTLCAGAFTDALLAEEPSLQLDEISFFAFKQYAAFDSEAALHHALHSTPHALTLTSLGFVSDIAVAADRDSISLAARIYHDEEFSYVARMK